MKKNLLIHLFEIQHKNNLNKYLMDIYWKEIDKIVTMKRIMSWLIISAVSYPNYLPCNLVRQL